jgi:hypothetical protein
MTARLLLLAIAILFSNASRVSASDIVWNAEVVATNAKGERASTSADYISDGAVTMPIDLGPLGICTIEINSLEPTGSPDSPAPNRTLTISITQPIFITGGGNTYQRIIYYSTLPVVLGKEIPLLKFSDSTVSVTLSVSK